MQLTDKYGLSAAVARKRAGLPPLHNLSLKSGQDSPGGSSGQVNLAPADPKGIDEVEVLPIEMLFSDTPPDLAQVTGLDQRLVQLDVQPSSTKGLFPRHKYLMIKRSQRCRKCEHNLSKPEYNPTSIKFKIQLAAYYHIPEVVIYKVANEPLISGATVNFVLKLSNPTQHPTNVEFMDLVEYLKTREANDAALAAEAAVKESEKAVSHIVNLAPQTYHQKVPPGKRSFIIRSY